MSEEEKPILLDFSIQRRALTSCQQQASGEPVQKGFDHPHRNDAMPRIPWDGIFWVMTFSSLLLGVYLNFRTF